jgi:uncharacterized glyoxalase superfamily protein PhnB
MLRNRSIPDCQVIPELAYPDVIAAAKWLCNAFGFSERLRVAQHRVQLTFGTGAVIVIQGSIDHAGSRSHAIMVRVENIDEHYAKSTAAGARVTGNPMTHAYGERQYAAQDLAGHRWVFTQSMADVDPRKWGGVVAG